MCGCLSELLGKTCNPLLARYNAAMRILVTNDDGILAPGIEALVRAVQPLGQVEVVAPETGQSAVGHGITVLTPMSVRRVHVNNVFHGWSVDGRPADCVKPPRRTRQYESTAPTERYPQQRAGPYCVPQLDGNGIGLQLHLPNVNGDVGDEITPGLTFAR